jgi:hypothetical protein
MKQKRHIILFILSIAGIWLIISSAFASAPLKKFEHLYKVKKIYLAEGQASRDSQKEIAYRKQMNSYLKQELAKVGFEIVGEAKNADGVLDTVFGIWVVADGPPLDPPKYSYTCKLTSLDNELLWQDEINVSGQYSTKVDQKAAIKIAGNLRKAWRKSAKQAGLVVGDRVQ